MASAAFLIYSGVMPLIKTFLSILIGYILSRKGLFPPAASKGASQVSMNVALPLLVFANIVPAFTPQNVSAMGPLFLLAFVYQAIGFIFGIIIREVFYIPQNFWQGILIMSGMSNWGNLHPALANAVVLAVMQQAPFNPDTDPALGVSFVSIFIVAYHLVFWVCGAAHSLSWDYRPGVPQGEAAEVHVPWKEKPLGSFFYSHIFREQSPSTCATTSDVDNEIPINEKGKEKDPEGLTTKATPYVDVDTLANDPDHELARRSSRLSAISRQIPAGPMTSRGLSSSAVLPSSQTSRESDLPMTHSNSSLIPPIIRRIFNPLSAVFTPVTVSLMISLPISLIQPLKALFVDVSSMGGPDWKGPDGRPPLAFLIDTGDFVGTMAIPLSLILLGASFARLSIPRPFSRLPISAMIAVAVGKMVVLPVIGVFIVQGMVGHGLISHDAKVEKFVAMFLSGTPAAVNQLIVASLYSADGDVNTLAAFLLVQYGFMFFSSSALTAVALLLS